MGSFAGSRGSIAVTTATGIREPATLTPSMDNEDHKEACTHLVPKKIVLAAVKSKACVICLAKMVLLLAS